MSEFDDDIMGGDRLVVLRDLNRSAMEVEAAAFDTLVPMRGPRAVGYKEFFAPSDGPKPTVEVVTASDDVPDPSSVLDTAAPMALSLVEPVSDARANNDGARSINSAKTDNISWGIKAIGADQTDLTGKGVTVAVLDTGIDLSHPAFSGRDDDFFMQKDFTVDKVRDPATGSEDYPAIAPDTDGHGTHCAGTIFGEDVEGVRIGVAKGIERALIAKVIGGKAGSGSLLEAIEWALANGANVISMSLGFDNGRYFRWLKTNGWGETPALSQTLTAYRDNIRMFDTLMAAIAARGTALGQNAIIIAATGNESKRPEYRVHKSSPSAAVGILSVGAVRPDQKGGYTIADFSNAQPDLVGPGVGIVSAGINGNTFASMNGTSMACPHIAGLASLYWESLSAQLQVSSRRVQSQLQSTAMHTRKDWFPHLGEIDTGDGMPWI